MSEVIRYDIMSPDHLRIAPDGDLVRHEDYQTIRDERGRLRANLVNCVARLEAYYGEDYPAVRDAKAALTATSQPGGTHEL